MRALPTAVLDQIDAPRQRLALFVAVKTAAGWLRAWTGRGTKAWDGNDYEGLGDLIAFGSPETLSDGTASPMTITLSAVPSEHMSRALTERVTGQPVQVRLMWLDAGGAILGHMLLWSGTGSHYQWADDGQTATLTLTAEGRLIETRQATRRRWTAEDQRGFVDADDAFFDGVADLQEKDLGAWGAG